MRTARFPGIEGFYVGLLDPFRALPQALALVCLGLLVSSFEDRRLLWFVGTFFLGTLGGIVLGADLVVMAPVLLAAATLSGAWAGLLPGRLLPVAFAFAVAVGFYLGAISIPDPGPRQARIVTVSGSFVGLNIGFLYVAGGIQMAKERFPAPWLPVALRIAALVPGVRCRFCVAKHW